LLVLFCRFRLSSIFLLALALGQEEGRGKGKYCRHVINIWFCNHRGHRLLDIALAELEESMLVPDSFEVKIWSTEMLF